MNIVLINPNSSPLISLALKKEAERYQTPKLRIEVLTSEHGPEVISTADEERQATIEVVELIKRVGNNYDAIIIGCFADPGLKESQGLIDIPVVGILQASLSFANAKNQRYSIISSDDDSDVELFHNLAAAYGYIEKLVSVRCLDCGVLEALTVQSALLESTIDDCLHLDGADLVIMGCAAFVGIKNRVSSRHSEYVIDGVREAINMAVDLVNVRNEKNEE